MLRTVFERTSGRSLREERLAAVVEKAAFWTAVGLPVGYLPILYVGLDDPVAVVLLVAVVCLHLAALSAGHAHRR